jgi:hypothetical protein
VFGCTVRGEMESDVLLRVEEVWLLRPGAVGHMDCTEIVRGEAVARNVPVVVRGRLASLLDCGIVFRCARRRNGNVLNGDGG